MTCRSRVVVNICEYTLVCIQGLELLALRHDRFIWIRTAEGRAAEIDDVTPGLRDAR